MIKTFTLTVNHYDMNEFMNLHINTSIVYPPRLTGVGDTCMFLKFFICALSLAGRPHSPYTPAYSLDLSYLDEPTSGSYYQRF